MHSSQRFQSGANEFGAIIATPIGSIFSSVSKVEARVLEHPPDLQQDWFCKGEAIRYA